MLTATDPLLLAESRVVARLTVNRLAVALGVEPVTVARTPVEIEARVLRVERAMREAGAAVRAVGLAARRAAHDMDRAAVEYRAMERLAMAVNRPPSITAIIAP